MARLVGMVAACIAALSCVTANSTAAQPSSGIGTWTNIGPSFSATRPGWSGRVEAVAVDPRNASRWLIGAAGGGVWETLDAGMTWAPKTDDQDSLAMGRIAFAPSSPNVVYAGTGEFGRNGGPIYAGAGLLKSIDGGTTWTLLASSTFAKATFAGLRVHTANPDLVLAATAPGTFSPAYFPIPSAPPTGILKSTDGGATWSLKLAGQATDVDVDPTNFNNQIAGIGNIFGGSANGVYRSTNAGETWTRISGPWDALPGGIGRIALAVAPSSPSTVYVSIQDAFNGAGDDGGLLGLFRTDNAWAPTPTWTQIPNAAGTGGFCTDPVFGKACHWAMVMLVDLADPSRLYAAGRSTVWQCTTCGASPTWTSIGSNFFDNHALAWAGSRLILGNDGGIYSTTNLGGSWTTHNTNLSITNIMAGSLHPTNPNFALAGAMDSGGGMKWTGTNAWSNLPGMTDPNDSAISASQPDTHWVIWGSGTGGSFATNGPLRTTDGGRSFVLTDAGIDHTNSSVVGRLEKCPTNDDILITGTDNLWRSNNFFSAPSPSWVSNGPEMGSGVNGRITGLAFASSDATCSTYAFGTASGQLRLTVNGGGNWVDLDPTNAVPNRYVTDLAFDPTDPNVLYVTLSGFDEGTPGQPGHFFKTTNALAASPTWSNVSPPVNVPLNTVAVHPLNPRLVFVGADIGVWTSADGGSTWAHMGPETGMPNVVVSDLKINPTTKRIVAFTFGRGAFVLTQLSLALSVNQSTFSVGQTLIAGGGVTNPGLSGAADFYVGLLRPDGSVQFFTGTGIVVGNVADLTSFRPIAVGVSLATPFSVTQPNFYTHQWTVGDPRGGYVFFLGVVKTGALADGTIASDQILGLATAPFSFP